jgi:uncharacterized GH25 family protein
MLKQLLTRATLVLSGLAIASPAAAHYIWIEQDEAHHARLYFGEYQEQLREASGGRLDKIKGPKAWKLDTSGNRQTLKITRQSDHFDLGVVNPISPIIAEEPAYDVMDLSKYGYGIVKPMFYARFSPLPLRSNGKPELALDILPAAESSSAFAVYFRNEPLARAKVMIYAPNQWMQEHRTDENGAVRITTPWPGHYVLDVVHVEKQPGEFQGKTFEAIRHRATLTFKATTAAHGN